MFDKKNQIENLSHLAACCPEGNQRPATDSEGCWATGVEAEDPFDPGTKGELFVDVVDIVGGCVSLMRAYIEYYLAYYYRAY